MNVSMFYIYIYLYEKTEKSKKKKKSTKEFYLYVIKKVFEKKQIKANI